MTPSIDCYWVGVVPQFIMRSSTRRCYVNTSFHVPPTNNLILHMGCSLHSIQGGNIGGYIRGDYRDDKGGY